ncbi:PepSY-associated TM helix domain-containing protein [Stakelama marina]|uniref:PepSY domain-containing protein n=1 Tax=Stakelama marina TaxID=2826939 RepID=A0A8T4IFB9_9SPHN|nr:PepSY-associated TM helix domain-containing protein [Stakelama marina]MBR0552554.1 PepSY domain-containing protein [Stakelama marina]
MTKIRLRGIWFQVHKWIGLLLAVLVVPLCLSGSVLVWGDAVDAALHPARHADMGKATLAPSVYLAAAQQRLGGQERIARITLPDRGGAVEVSAVEAGKSRGRPVRTTVYLDPRDAHVIDMADSGSGVLRTMHILHGSLMVPGVGRQVVGWVGVAMFVSALSGIWLWWPTVGSWIRGLRWRRHRNFDTNLHHLFGFWIALPLAILAVTGAWISFPQFFGRFDAPQPAREGPSRAERFRARPLAEPATAFEQVLVRAAAVAPGNVRSVTWPTNIQPSWSVETVGGTARVADTGDSVSLRSARGRGEGRRDADSLSRTMRTIHDGHDMPFVWQVIVFLGGILPTILAITGVIMWWRARGWRAKQAARAKARRR